VLKIAKQRREDPDEVHIKEIDQELDDAGKAIGQNMQPLSPFSAPPQPSSRKPRREGEDPDEVHIKEIEGELDDAANSRNKAFKHMQRGPGHHGDAKKPMMDGMEVARMMMCWGRQHLLDHDQCMAWMVQNCKEETTGHGYCRKLRRYVKAKCKRGNEKGCDYAKKLGMGEKKEVENDAEQIDSDDQDGDGVKDSDDAFPDNPIESKDSDGDNIGDNTDKYPKDPTRAHPGDKAPGTMPGGLTAAPSPAAAGSPAPGPMPTGLTMDAGALLPSQGYNEHSKNYVAHEDGSTMTEDWRGEWPMSDGSEEDSIVDICAKQPNHAWCRLKQSREARQDYARSHH